MAIIAWDRLMETCRKQGGSEIVMAVGCSPYLRVKEGLATLKIAPLSGDDLERMVADIQRPPSLPSHAPSYPYVEHDGYRCLDITYAEGEVFRVVVFGSPSPAFVLLLRISTMVSEVLKEAPPEQQPIKQG